MKRYNFDCNQFSEDATGEWVRFEDADKRIHELEAEVVELLGRLARETNRNIEQANRAEKAEAAIARVKKLHRTKEHFMHEADVLAALRLRK